MPLLQTRKQVVESNDNKGQMSSNFSHFEIQDSSSSQNNFNDVTIAPSSMDGFVGSGAIDSGDAGISPGNNKSNAPFSSSSTARGSETNNTNNNNNSGNTRPLWERMLFCFSIESYQQYFDVNTSDVKTRIIAAVKDCNAVNRFREQVLGREGSSPDLYGPWWITTTLVFLVAVTSNLSMYLHADSSEDFEYDVNHIARSMSVLYSFVFILPVLLYFAFQCAGVSIPCLDMVCLYGYSLVPFLPATILCTIPSDIIIWLSLVVATCISLNLVVKNVIGPILSGGGRKEGPVLMSVIGFHVLFLLVLKLSFYHHHKIASYNNQNQEYDVMSNPEDDVLAAVEENFEDGGY